MIFDCQSFSQCLKLSGSISYKVGEEGNGVKDFTLSVPSSSSVLPVKLEKENFVSLLRENSSTFQLNSTEIKLSSDNKQEFQSFIASLALLLHTELINQENGATSLYGKSVQGQHVALLVRSRDNGIVSVQLKSNDDSFGKSLISEVNAFFPKP